MHREVRPTVALTFFHTLFWWKLKKNVENRVSYSACVGDLTAFTVCHRGILVLVPYTVG